MIASVVKHDHRFLSPTNIFSIKVSTIFNKNKEKVLLFVIPQFTVYQTSPVLHIAEIKLTPRVLVLQVT